MNKRIFSLLLAVILLLSSISGFATAGTIDVVDGNYYLRVIDARNKNTSYLDILVQDSQIYASVESWNNIVNPETQPFNSYTNRWMVAGAGKFKFAIAENGHCININGSKHIQGFAANPNSYPLIIKNNTAYFPLFPTMFNLGISGACTEDALILCVPGSTESELKALCKEIMRDWGVMEVNTMRDKDEGFWEKQGDGVLIALDIISNVISNGKLVEAATETYVDDLLEDAIIGSLAGESLASIEDTEHAWAVWDGFSSLISTAELPDKSVNAYSRIFLGEKMTDVLYMSEINPIDVGNVAFGTYVEYCTKTQKINSIAMGNLIRAIHIFDDEAISDDHSVKKAIKKVTKEYINSSADLEEIVVNGIINGTASIAFDKGLDIILSAPAQWAKLYLDCTLLIMQELTDYNYGDLSTLLMYDKFQNSIKYAYELKNQNDDNTLEYYRYLHDCAMLYCQVKQASYEFMEINADIRTGAGTKDLYSELCSTSYHDIYISNPQVAKEISLFDEKTLLNLLIDADDFIEYNPEEILAKFEFEGVYQYTYVYDIDADMNDEYIIVINNQMGKNYNVIVDINDFLLVGNGYYYDSSDWNESLLVDENNTLVFKSEIDTDNYWETNYTKYIDNNYYLRKGAYGNTGYCQLNYNEITKTTFNQEEDKFKPLLADEQKTIFFTTVEQELFTKVIDEMVLMYNATFPYEYYVEGRDIIVLHEIKKNPNKTMGSVCFSWMQWEDYCQDYIGMAQTDYLELDAMQIIRSIGGGVSPEDEVFLKENGWIS